MTIIIAVARAAALAIVILTSSSSSSSSGAAGIVVVRAAQEQDRAVDDGDEDDARPPADAFDRYSAESRSLLVRSMLYAGFDAEDADGFSGPYLDLATRALRAEMGRVGRMRDGLMMLAKMKEEEEEEAKEGTCSVVGEDGRCVVDPPPTKEEGKAATEKTRTKYGDGGGGSKAEHGGDEFEHFLPATLSPGQVDLLRWESDGGIVQEYGARVGLPPDLVPTLIGYARDMGLLDIMTNMLYDDPLPPDGARWFTFQSPYQTNQTTGTGGTGGTGGEEERTFTWNVERPAKKWKSDMHWFNTADELSHEDMLRALARGGFDDVLRGIGESFGLDELHVDSVGFVAVTECERGFMHTDWDDVDGRAFNFLVGISTPEGAGPELVVADGEGRRRGETYYGSNGGVLVGDGTMHGTRECDHRPYRGVRITASIYLADVTRENLSTLAGDTTSIFPPLEEDGEGWIWSQRGRHWNKGGGGPGLVGDRGRAPFRFEDVAEGCTRDDCANEGDRPRNACLRTCKVFMDDETEYMPGKERREVFGY